MQSRLHTCCRTDLVLLLHCFGREQCNTQVYSDEQQTGEFCFATARGKGRAKQKDLDASDGDHAAISTTSCHYQDMNDVASPVPNTNIRQILLLFGMSGRGCIHSQCMVPSSNRKFRATTHTEPPTGKCQTPKPCKLLPNLQQPSQKPRNSGSHDLRKFVSSSSALGALRFGFRTSGLGQRDFALGAFGDFYANMPCQAIPKLAPREISQVSGDPPE